MVFADFGDRLSFVRGGELVADRARSERRAGGREGARQSRAQGGAALAARVPAASRWALSTSTRAAGRGRPRRRLGRRGSGATPPRRGQRHRARRSGSLSPLRAPPAPTCRSASIRARASCAASANVLSAPLVAAGTPGGAGQSGCRADDQGGVRALDGSPAAAPVALDVAALAKLDDRDALVRLLATRPTTWSRLPLRCAVDRRCAGALCAHVLAAPGAHVRLGGDLLRIFPGVRRREAAKGAHDHQPTGGCRRRARVASLRAEETRRVE